MATQAGTLVFLVEQLGAAGPGAARKMFRECALYASCGPLWRMVLVRWAAAARACELKFQEQMLRAAEACEVSLEITSIVVNCPVTRAIDGPAIRGAQ